MQKQENKNKKTDFISFLKNSWFVSGSSREIIFGDKIQLAAEERAQRFYRSLEDGKLTKVLDTVVSEDIEMKEDLDDSNAQSWQREKNKSENDIIKKRESIKKKIKRFQQVLNSPVNPIFNKIEREDYHTKSSSNNLSFAWKYATVSIVVLFLSFSYVNLYPEKAQSSVTRLDKLFISPVTAMVDTARRLQLSPGLKHEQQFTNSLPGNKVAINKDVKSDYVRNMSSEMKVTIENDGDYASVTEDDVRSIFEDMNIDSEIVVLGVDSGVEIKKENKIIKSVKDFLRKIADKQEKMSSDLNERLDSFIVE